MIKSIRIANFKSIAQLTLYLGRFNCLVGMNGAGKSTLLQAFDFLSHLMLGDIDVWLKERNWDIGDLNNKLRKESNITLTVHYGVANGDTLHWVGVFNRSDLRCTREFVLEVKHGTETEHHSRKLLNVEKGSFLLDGRHRQDIAFTYQGSILSALKDAELPASVLEFRDAMRRMRSLELLSPQLLRKRARTSDHDIGSGGEKLSAFLDNIKGQKKTELLELLKRLYPALAGFKV